MMRTLGVGTEEGVEWMILFQSDCSTSKIFYHYKFVTVYMTGFNLLEGGEVSPKHSNLLLQIFANCIKNVGCIEYNVIYSIKFL